MDTRIVNLDLMEFVERNILPRYNNFDKAHNLNHANLVIKNSLALALSTGADINMAYAIAAYHDLGLEGPRAIHHLSSGKILMADRRLRRWFSEEQIKIMKEAVEDHRASASHVQYGLTHYPEKCKEEHWERFLQHMDQKYSSHGYIRLWMTNSPNEKKLKEIRDALNNKDALRNTFERIFNEENQE